MTTLYLKIILIPLLVTAVSLATRRFGHRVGGFVATLPVVAGPLLLILALEQGKHFAEHAAVGALKGLLSLLAFSLCYYLSCQRLRYLPCLLLSCAAYFAIGFCSLFWSLSAFAALLLLLPLIFLTSAFIGRRTDQASDRPVTPIFWGRRIFASVSLVVLVSTASEYLGPTASGLLAPFPVVGTIVCFFLHRHEGFRAVQRFLFGYVQGLYGYVAFFYLVANLVSSRSIITTFSLAIIACLVGQALALLFAKRLSHYLWGQLRTNALTKKWFESNSYNWGYEQ